MMELTDQLRATAAEIRLRHLEAQIGHPTHLMEAANEIERLEQQYRELTVPRPIGTAPKDGSRILVNVYWPENTHNTTAICTWLPDNPGLNEEGWFSETGELHHESIITGWLPLPEVTP